MLRRRNKRIKCAFLSVSWSLAWGKFESKRVEGKRKVVEKKRNRRGCPEGWDGRRMVAERGSRQEKGAGGCKVQSIARLPSLGSYSTPIEGRYRHGRRAVTIADSLLCIWVLRNLNVPSRV